MQNGRELVIVIMIEKLYKAKSLVTIQHITAAELRTLSEKLLYRVLVNEENVMLGETFNPLVFIEV